MGWKDHSSHPMKCTRPNTPYQTLLVCSCIETTPQAPVEILLHWGA